MDSSTIKHTIIQDYIIICNQSGPSQILLGFVHAVDAVVKDDSNSNTDCVLSTVNNTNVCALPTSRVVGPSNSEKSTRSADSPVLPIVVSNAISKCYLTKRVKRVRDLLSSARSAWKPPNKLKAKYRQ